MPVTSPLCYDSQKCLQEMPHIFWEASSPWVENHCCKYTGFPGGASAKEPTCQCRRPWLIPGWGRSPGIGNSNSLQYSCLENPMDRGAWWTTVHGVTRSWIRLNWLSRHALSIWRYLAFLSLIITSFTFRPMHTLFFFCKSLLFPFGPRLDRELQV